MGAVAVRDRDPLQVGWAPAERPDRLEHEPRVAFEERVDEGELAAVVDQERVNVPALAVAEAVDSRCELGHDAPVPARGHGAKGFFTPCSAGSSSGKWRRSSVRIELLSTQSMPSLV